MIELKAYQLPETWTSQGDGYEFFVEVDADGNDSGWISASKEHWHSGSLKKRMAAEPFLGKRIRLVGECRSKDVLLRAGLLLRIEKGDGSCITQDYMLERPQIGTVDWQRCQLVLDVPLDAGCVLIGAHLRGTGQVWFKDLRVEEISPSVAATTDQHAMGCVGIWDPEPINLDFSHDELSELREDRPYISEARRWIISYDDESSPYKFSRSREVLFKGEPAAHVSSVSLPGEGYLYQHFAAARFRNKRVRFSAFVKTKSVEKGAWLRANIFDSDNKDLVWKYSGRGVSGTTDWTKLEIEFDVPREAYVIDIGADLSGVGEMYLGGLEFEVLGKVELQYSELMPGIVLYDPPHDGWFLERASGIRTIPDRPGKGIQLNAVKPGPRTRSSAGVWLSSVPVNHELNFSCLLRGSISGQIVTIHFIAWSARNRELMRSATEVSLDDKTWTSFNSKYVAPKNTHRVHIWIVSVAAHAAYLTQPRLLLGNPSEEPEEGEAPAPKIATKVRSGRNANGQSK